MNTITLEAPSISISKEFDKMYNSALHWIWSDIRIPKELKELIKNLKPRNSLELGCGLGLFSSFMAEEGVKATGVDFSAAAIEKAKKRVADNQYKPKFIVGDVTCLDMLTGKFDVSFDVGCFHCLREEEQHKYASEVARLLKPGAVHLIWALDNNFLFTPECISTVFAKDFQLVNSALSRRRVLASHWYWLVRK